MKNKKIYFYKVFIFIIISLFIIEQISLNESYAINDRYFISDNNLNKSEIISNRELNENMIIDNVLNEQNLNKSIEKGNFILEKNIKEISNIDGTQNGEYKVELTITRNYLDIVLAIDTSYSVGCYNKWITEVKCNLQSLIIRLLDYNNVKDNIVRIGLITYSGSNKNKGSIDDATIIHDFTSNKEKLIATLDNINEFGGSGGTYEKSGIIREINYIDPLNIEAALLKAKEMLKDSPSKLLLLYSDGPPTTGIGKYFTNKPGINNTNSYYDEFKEDIIYTRNLLLEDNINIIAFGDKTTAEDFVYNNGDKQDYIYYKQFVVKNTLDILESITTLKIDKNYKDVLFQEVGNSYSGKIFGNSAHYANNFIEQLNIKNEVRDVILKDKVPKVFQLIEDSYSDRDISEDEEYTYITWRNLNLEDNKCTIKYRMKLRDEYFYGNDILKEVKTTIQWLEDSTIKEQDFNNPILNIKTVGKLNIVLNNYNDLEDYIITIENIERNKKYEFNINAGEINIIEVILVSDFHNTNNIANIFAIGKYKVTVTNIIDGYEVESIYINGEENDEFLIDKYNNDINIEINNKKINLTVKSNIYIENNIDDILSYDDNINNESFYIILENIDENKQYSLKSNLNDIYENDIYIIENYSEIPKDFDKNLNFIKSGQYKIRGVLPSGFNIKDIEIKINDNTLEDIGLNDKFNLKRGDDIFIKLNYYINNKKYWYKRKVL